MTKFMRIGEAATALNVHVTTMRNYAKSGRINFDLTPSGQRVFTQKHLDEFLGRTNDTNIAFYCRSSGGDERALALQEEKLTQVYGEPLLTVKDKGSGLNEKRPGLQKLIKLAKNGELTTIAMTAKDRLTRFGFTYLEELFDAHGVKLVVLDNEVNKSLNEELMQDFMSLIASFSGKFYRLRGYEHKKLLLEKAKEELDAKANK